MHYIYNSHEKDLFNTEDIIRILEFNKKDVEIPKFENIEQIKADFEEFIEKNGLEDEIIFDVRKQKFVKEETDSNSDYIRIDSKFFEEFFKTKTSEIRNDIISKYILSENLNFLIGNGCSNYAGSKAINQEAKENNLTEILKNNNINDKKLNNILISMSKERPEKVLDKLIQIRNYYNLVDNEILNKINEIINNYKKQFLEHYVLNIDYSKNHFHKMFLKRIISRESHLNKVNIFTLNYDLLIEKSAEELGIIVNNGFFGFTVRKFDPSYYNIDYHIKGFNKIKPFNKSINLYKLHGSINWKEDPSAVPYGIVEQQPTFKDGKLEIEDYENKIIYPVQTKIKQSLDLPYSEIFRAFVNQLNSKNSTLIIIGYSFYDDHVNDIIANSLSNPDFNLVVFSYENEKENSENLSPFLKNLYALSKEDKRITIFSGPILGRFEYIVKYLIPYYNNENLEECLYNTIIKLKEGKNNV